MSDLSRSERSERTRERLLAAGLDLLPSTVLITRARTTQTMLGLGSIATPLAFTVLSSSPSGEVEA
jgi:hypothetical protein